MSAISAVWLYVGWGAVHFETNYGLMQHSPFEIKEKLLKALDKEYNVVDMAAVVEIVSILERTAITKEALETTRLGRYINELRRKTTNDSLARRAKDLVRRWRDMILPTPAPPGSEPPSGATTQQPPAPPPIVAAAATQNGSSGATSAAAVRVAPPRTLSPASSNTSPVQSSGATNEAAVPRTHASNKRLRKEAVAPLDVAAPPAKKPKLNGASLVAPPPPDECSRDCGATTGGSDGCEIVTIIDELTDTNDSKTSSTTTSKTKKSRQKDKKSSNSDRRRSKSDRRTGDDILKEKIASIARTPRVKTTQELVADLRSRSNSDTNAVIDVDSDVIVTKSIETSVNSDEVLTRNKTEHMAKFLRSQHESDDDSVVVVVDLVDESQEKKVDVKERSTKDHKRSKQQSSAEKDGSETTVSPERTLQEILARLPPLDVDSIVWDNESPPSTPPPPREITQDDVERLHNEHVENLNGNFDHAPADAVGGTNEGDNFREWHETVSRTSYNGELLHILPYVVID